MKKGIFHVKRDMANKRYVIERIIYKIVIPSFDTNITDNFLNMNYFLLITIIDNANYR